MNDFELLRRYGRGRDEEAFAELMRRHVDWVYSACRRQVGDAALAEDAAQAVFLALARKAGTLGEQTSISGWLFTTARYVCASARKLQKRRQKHERQAASMARDESDGAGEERWLRIERTVDEGLSRLSAADRELVILRYLRGLSHREIGAAMCITEAAAQRRVGRAMERLRGKLRGAAPEMNAEGLGVVLLAHAHGAAPAGVAERGMAAVKGGSVAGKAEILLRGVKTMRRAMTIKVTGAVTVGLMVVAVGLAARLNGEGSPETAAAAASVPETTVLATMDLSGVKVFRVNGETSGVTWTNTYSWEDGVVQELSAEGWSAVHLFRGRSEWDYRTGGDVVLEKKPEQEAGAQTRKMMSELMAMQGVHGRRAKELDEKIGGVMCEAYRLGDVRGGAKNGVVYVDAAAQRPMRIASDDPGATMTVAYDPAVKKELFQTPAATGKVQEVAARAYFEKRYPLERALFRKEAVGQIFAVHEAVQDGQGCFHLVCSARVAPAFAGVVKDLPDDENVNLCEIEDGETAFAYLRVGEVRESGIRVMYVVAVPRQAGGAGDQCEVPMKMASPDVLFDLGHAPHGDNQGRDVHFMVSVQSRRDAQAPTAREFVGRVYDEVAPLVGLTPELFVIGPGKGAELTSKESCLEFFDKELGKVVENR
ncbi:MAG TPA: RNA polymerase sigma factor [Phycisphaerae bacterium]|nr:RNA polymerase sigma factor [Phycisphaerae bacterium]